VAIEANTEAAFGGSWGVKQDTPGE